MILTRLFLLAVAGLFAVVIPACVLAVGLYALYCSRPPATFMERQVFIFLCVIATCIVQEWAGWIRGRCLDLAHTWTCGCKETNDD